MVENKDTVMIVVNTEEKNVSLKDLSRNGEISFDKVVELAFDTPPSGQDIMFSVYYRNGAGRPPNGRLSEGKSVKVKDGTVFNVTYTDKS